MDRGSMTLNLLAAEETTEKYQIIMYTSYSDVIKLDGSTVSSSISL